MGLHRAWPDAEIVGVDIKPQPRYPFRFVEMDWLCFLMKSYSDCVLGSTKKAWDFIWASPPCQRYSRFTPNKKKWNHPDLIPNVREQLQWWNVAAEIPYVIENVPCSPLRRDLVLVGAHFGSALIRERWFEASFILLAPDKPKPIGKPLHFGGNSQRRKVAGRDELAKAMGIDWMTRGELGQSVPPAYSEYIARQFEAGRSKQERAGT